MGAEVYGKGDRMAGMSAFKFRVSTNLRFGAGECEKLGEEILTLGFQRVAVIIDKGVVNNQQVLKALKTIEQAGILFDVCTWSRRGQAL